MLIISVVQLKGKHCQKTHCRNGVVDTFGLWQFDDIFLLFLDDVFDYFLTIFWMFDFLEDYLEVLDTFQRAVLTQAALELKEVWSCFSSLTFQWKFFLNISSLKRETLLCNQRCRKMQLQKNFNHIFNPNTPFGIIDNSYPAICHVLVFTI